ncbi:hypothetical protein BG452_05395 [Streptomyces sp. CBMA123]|nr:hypothetical protein [Streptomyces sp. CBMA123]
MSQDIFGESSCQPSIDLCGGQWNLLLGERRDRFSAHEPNAAAGAVARGFRVPVHARGPGLIPFGAQPAEWK